MDGVLFVIRGSYTGTRIARRALDLLYERQAKVLGIVFNRANASSGSYNYYNYADYFSSVER
jgi:Mrp family chromosome partitioning ATPase